MNTTTLTLLLQVAAVLHLGLLCAGLSMPRAVDLHSHLAPLPVFIRNLFYVYYGFIGLIIIAFGLMTYLFAAPMAEGAAVARGLCILMAVFWIARLVVASFVFDMKPYLRTAFHRIGYFGLNAVFLYFVLIYTYVAWRGGAV